MIAVGIDAGTYCGLCRLDGDAHTAKLINFPKERGIPRAQLIAKGVGNFLDDVRPDVTCMEGPAQGVHGNVSTFVTCVEIMTLIKLEFARRKLLYYLVPPSTLKLFVGKGNAKKQQVKEAVMARWSYESNSDDVIDAYVLARIAQAITVEGGIPSHLKGVSRHES